MNEINISKPTRAQIKKMSSGGSVVMKAGEHPVLVHPVNFKRMSKSFMKGKGRIKFYLIALQSALRV